MFFLETRRDPIWNRSHFLIWILLFLSGIEDVLVNNKKETRLSITADSWSGVVV